MIIVYMINILYIILKNYAQEDENHSQLLLFTLKG